MDESNEKELTPEAEREALRYFGEEMLDGRVRTQWKEGQSGNLGGRPKEPEDATPTEWLIWALGKVGLKALAKELNIQVEEYLLLLKLLGITSKTDPDFIPSSLTPDQVLLVVKTLEWMRGSGLNAFAINYI